MSCIVPSLMSLGPTGLGAERCVTDHKPEELELLCAVREGFLEEVMPHWALKEDLDAQSRGEVGEQRQGANKPESL